MVEKSSSNNLSDAIKKQMAAKKPAVKSSEKGKPKVSPADIQKLMQGLPADKRHLVPDDKSKEEAVERLKKLFEEQRQNLKDRKEKIVDKPVVPAKKPAVPKPTPKPPIKREVKPEPKPELVKPKQDPPAEKPPEKLTPAERLKKVLAEREAERKAQAGNKPTAQEDKESDEEAKERRYKEARKLAEAEVNKKYATPGAVSESPIKPYASPKDLPKKPTIKQKLERSWNALCRSRFGRTIKTMLHFYQRMGAVLIWSIGLLVLGRYALKYLPINIDLFNIAQVKAIKVLYLREQVPFDIVLGLLVLFIVWLIGSSLFYRKGWPWVRPIYMFLLQLAAMPIGLGLFMLFITMLLTNHIWDKLQSA